MELGHRRAVARERAEEDRVSNDLSAAIEGYLDDLREELWNVDLFETERIRNTAEIELQSLLLLVERTPAIVAQTGVVAAAFEIFHHLALRIGPLPRDMRIRDAHAAADRELSKLELVLREARPSQIALKLGLG
jgi:hypothetical protein